MAAVRELLAEGTFHETPVETVAERAGVSRATLYQHFGSRLGLVDAMCDTFAANPRARRRPPTRTTLDEWIGHVVDFWAFEEPVLVQLYGVAAADPAAADLVARQRRDRYAELERLLERIGARRRPRAVRTPREPDQLRDVRGAPPRRRPRARAGQGDAAGDGRGASPS